VQSSLPTARFQTDAYRFAPQSACGVHTTAARDSLDWLPQLAQSGGCHHEARCPWRCHSRRHRIACYRNARCAGTIGSCRGPDARLRWHAPVDRRVRSGGRNRYRPAAHRAKGYTPAAAPHRRVSQDAIRPDEGRSEATGLRRSSSRPREAPRRRVLFRSQYSEPTSRGWVGVLKITTGHEAQPFSAVCGFRQRPPVSDATAAV
jgi:hypothetical protein